MNSRGITSSIFGLAWIILAGGCDGTLPFARAQSMDPVASSPVVEPLAVPPPPIKPDLFIVPPATAQTVEVEQADSVAVDEPAAAPAEAPEPAPQEIAESQVSGPEAETDVEEPAEAPVDGFALLGSIVPPGEMQQLTWSATETFTGTAIPTAVLVVNGADPGPTLCLTAAVHGDELNGIETVRRVVHDVRPDKLTGTLIAVPIVNLEAFHRHSRYLPDRRDLNRFFPGNPTGSSASRIAHSFFTEVIAHCDGLVDLHTGSFHRTNLPQLRADLNVEAVVELTKGFGATVTLHSEGGHGTLRRAAVDAGIPAVTLEAGA
ncbi:MAG: succinylglutamate desuccinylase/aspartoacylase family protein, partial [Gammaproteobacteria bacterium]|nr:succinylglutamate desuccinylase/aspartoacylase family protein [Gammaproteobacteria bacterium]